MNKKKNFYDWMDSYVRMCITYINVWFRSFPSYA